MNEQEWLTCSNPLRMLHYLRPRSEGRKTLLLTAACLRRIWDVLPQEGCAWIEMAESAADSQCPYDASLNEGCEFAIQTAAHTTGWGYDGVISAMQQIFHVFWEDATLIEPDDENSERDTESRHQADLIRCIFGNPFRLPAIEGAWNSATIPNLAQAIYDERAFDRMPILTDALEEAGCNNEEILGHLRGAGPHVKGCWALDVLLGKE